jgi:hypothetical protein
VIWSVSLISMTVRSNCHSNAYRGKRDFQKLIAFILVMNSPCLRRSGGTEHVMESHYDVKRKHYVAILFICWVEEDYCILTVHCVKIDSGLHDIPSPITDIISITENRGWKCDLWRFYVDLTEQADIAATLWRFLFRSSARKSVNVTDFL